MQDKLDILLARSKEIIQKIRFDASFTYLSFHATILCVNQSNVIIFQRLHYHAQGKLIVIGLIECSRK